MNTFLLNNKKLFIFLLLIIVLIYVTYYIHKKQKKNIENFQILAEMPFDSAYFKGRDSYNLALNAYLANEYDRVNIPTTQVENENSLKGFGNFDARQNIFSNYTTREDYDKLTKTLYTTKKMLGDEPKQDTIELRYCPDEFKMYKNKTCNSILNSEQTVDTEYDCQKHFRDKGSKAIGYNYDNNKCYLIDTMKNNTLKDKTNSNIGIYGGGSGLQFTISYWLYVENRPYSAEEESEYYEIITCSPIDGSNNYYFPRISICGNRTLIKLEISCKDDNDNENIFESIIPESNLGTNKWHFIAHTMFCKEIKHYVDIKLSHVDTLTHPINNDALKIIDTHYNLKVRAGSRKTDKVYIAQLKINPISSDNITIQVLSYSYPEDQDKVKNILCKKGNNNVAGETSNFPIFCKPHRINEASDSIITPQSISGSRVPVFYPPNEVNSSLGSCYLREHKCDTFQDYKGIESFYNYNYCDSNSNLGVSKNLSNPEWQYSRPIDVNIDNGIYYRRPNSKQSPFRDPTVTVYTERDKRGTGKDNISGRVYLSGTIFINLKDDNRLSKDYKYNQREYDNIGLFIGKINESKESKIIFYPSDSVYFQIGPKQGYRIEIKPNGEIYVNRPITDPLINLDGISWLPFRDKKNRIPGTSNLRADLTGEILLLAKEDKPTFNKINFFNTDRKCRFVRITPGRFRKIKSLMFCEVEIIIKGEKNTSSEGLVDNIAKGKKARMSSIYMNDRLKYGPMIAVNGLVTVGRKSKNDNSWIAKEEKGRNAYKFGTTLCGSDKDLTPFPHARNLAGEDTATGIYQSEEGSYIRTADGDTNPWWEVDLEGEYIIEKITIFNKLDQGSHLDLHLDPDQTPNYYPNMNTIEGGKIILYDKKHEPIKDDIEIKNKNAVIDEEDGSCNDAMGIKEAIDDKGIRTDCISWDQALIGAPEKELEDFKTILEKIARAKNLVEALEKDENTKSTNPKLVQAQIEAKTDKIPERFKAYFNNNLIVRNPSSNLWEVQDDVPLIAPQSALDGNRKRGTPWINLRDHSSGKSNAPLNLSSAQNFCRYVDNHAGTKLEPWQHKSSRNYHKRISCYYDREEGTATANPGRDTTKGGTKKRGECVGPEYADPVAHESKKYFTRKYTIELVGHDDPKLIENGYSELGSNRIKTGWDNYTDQLSNSIYKNREAILYKYNDTVYLSGIIQYKSGDLIYDLNSENKKITDNYIYPIPSVIGKLPKNYRPSRTVMCQVTNNVDYAKIEVRSTGHVIVKEASRKKYKDGDNVPFRKKQSAREQNLLCLDGVKFQIEDKTKPLELCSKLDKSDNCALEPYKNIEDKGGNWDLLEDYINKGNKGNGLKKPNLMNALIFRYSYYNLNEGMTEDNEMLVETTNNMVGKNFGNLPKYRTSGDVTITFFMQIRPNPVEHVISNQVIIGKNEKGEGAVFLNKENSEYVIEYRCGYDNSEMSKPISVKSKIKIYTKYVYFVAIVRDVSTKDIKIYINNESHSDFNKIESGATPLQEPTNTESGLSQYSISEHSLKIGQALDNTESNHLSKYVVLNNIYIFNKAMDITDLEAVRNLNHLVGRDYGVPKCIKDPRNGLVKLEGSFIYKANPIGERSNWEEKEQKDSREGVSFARRFSEYRKNNDNNLDELEKRDMEKLKQQYPLIGSIITVLPEGFRPNKSVYFSVNDGFKAANVEIDQNGKIRWWGYKLGYHNIDSIVFEDEKDLVCRSRAVCLDGIEFLMLKEN